MPLGTNAWTRDARDTTMALTFTAPFERREARALSQLVCAGADAGARRFIIDVAGASPVNEGFLVLTLLGLRGELRRRSARILVTAEPELADRLTRSLRLDAVITVIGLAQHPADGELEPAGAREPACTGQLSHPA